ncbi:MAG: DUF3575 domain-containing protein [Bacteroidales bacterium]|nr:DUF3575 domain-containing protein [Bacteroidales bacterium]
MKKLILILTIIIGIAGQSYSQDTINQDDQKQKKNIIRWNVTPMAISFENLTLGYERILKNNQSFSINIGVLLFPKFLNNDSLEVSVVEHGNRFGFSTAMDYRFYLKKRNKYAAPNGIYIGPYFTYYQYSFDNKIRLVDDANINNEISTDAAFSMTSIGFELGYQFIFWDKLSLDLILVGPSISYYKGKVDLSGDFSIDEDSEAYQYIEDQILEKYPWIKSFMDIGAINTGGKFNSTGLGFRYVVQVGFHF